MRLAEDYLVDGMTEALITELAKIGALKVISRTSAMRYKNHSQRLRRLRNSSTWTRW